MTAATAKKSSRRKTFDGPKPEEKIVAQLVDLLEAGVNPWRREWDASTGHHCNLLSGHRYSGNNVILLELAMMAKGQTMPYWCGFNEAKTAGLSVKKGSKAAYIFRPNPCSAEVEKENGDIEKVSWMTFRSIAVFHVSDLEGEALDEVVAKRREAAGAVVRSEPDRMAHAEEVLGGWDVKVNWGGDRAFYSPATDQIGLPMRDQFHSAAALYATWAHEAIHSTGHHSRLDRPMECNHNSSAYAREELVAELGSILLGQRLEIGSQIDNHASYIQHWIKELKEDPSFLFKALKQAKKAADLVYPAMTEA